MPDRMKFNMYCSVSYILASASVESQGAAFVHKGEGEKLYRGGYFGSTSGYQIEAAQPGGHASAMRPIVGQKRVTAMVGNGRTVVNS